MIPMLALAQNPHLSDILGDHTLPHEALPRGLPEGVDWRSKPRVGMGNRVPEGWNAFTAWGQVYEPVGNSPSVNTRVEIRNIQAWILSKSSGKWVRIQFDPTISGSFYVEDFKDDVNKPGDLRNEPGGAVSVRTSVGYNFHFWPKQGRIAIDPKDIAGVYTAVQARLTIDDPKKPDDRAKARFMMSMGADYWKAVDAQWDQFKTNGDAMIGRFRFIQPRWGWHHATTLGPDELRKNPPPAPATRR